MLLFYLLNYATKKTSCLNRESNFLTFTSNHNNGISTKTKVTGMTEY